MNFRWKDYYRKSRKGHGSPSCYKKLDLNYHRLCEALLESNLLEMMTLEIWNFEKLEILILQESVNGEDVDDLLTTAG